MNVSFSALEQEVSSAQFTERDMETMKGIGPGEEARRIQNHVFGWINYLQREM